MRKCIAVLVLCFLIAGNIKATHIVGGEMYYDCLGNNNYKITLKLYRDCINGQAPYDDPLSIGIYDAAGNLIQNLYIPFPGAVLLPITLNNPCFTAPGNVCVEEAIYTATVNLPPLPGGYTLAYQRCCRNQTILNLVNPLAVGFTITATIPDPGLAFCNNAPRFDSLPPLFCCANTPFNFNHAATDPDGDSLVYEFCDPYDGASQANPMPQPPVAPPYWTVPFQAPYSGTYPISSNPAMAINLNTGWLTGTPNMIGQWVVGICVKEYRNGQLIGVHMRDYQYNVVNCPPVPVSSIPSQTTFCFGYSVNFINSSVNSSSYYWDFGDPNTTADNSTAFQPSWTYSDSGVYNVMLIANPGSPCADTGYTTFYIYPLLNPFFIAPPPQCVSTNSFNFTAAGAFLGNGTFTWNFGPNATPQNSGQQNPVGIVFNAPGLYPVTLTVTENGCTKTFTDTVNVTPPPQASFSMPPQAGCPPLTIQFANASVVGTGVSAVYLWDFGDGSTSSSENPSHTYFVPGTYTVTLTLITLNGCIDTVIFSMPNIITVHPVPVAGFSADPLVTSVFNPNVTFTDLSQNAISCMLYFGDGNISNNCNVTHTYMNYGHYNVTQVVENEFGCRASAMLEIIILPEFRFFIPNAFTPQSDGKNDVFMPKIMGVEDYHFMIFDRWGQLFFETRDINAGWDGRFKGDLCQEDVYVWKITFTDLVETRKHSYVGHVSLIR